MTGGIKCVHVGDVVPMNGEFDCEYAPCQREHADGEEDYLIDPSGLLVPYAKPFKDGYAPPLLAMYRSRHCISAKVSKKS